MNKLLKKYLILSTMLLLIFSIVPKVNIKTEAKSKNNDEIVFNKEFLAERLESEGKSKKEIKKIVNENREQIKAINKEYKKKGTSFKKAAINGNTMTINAKSQTEVLDRGCSWMGAAQAIASGVLYTAITGAYVGGVWFPPGYALALAVAVAYMTSFARSP